MRKLQVVFGLGFGDEGKGSVVDYLSYDSGADLIIKPNGGSQAAHNVVLPDGTHHTFAAFGSGSFHGTRTYLAHNFLVDPVAILLEAEKLAPKLLISVDELLDRLIISDFCAVVTPWHILLNRLKERSNKHGSCGMGIGETRRYTLKYGDYITVGDIVNNIDKAYKNADLCKQRLLIDAQDYIIDEETLEIVLEMARQCPCEFISRAFNVLNKCTLSTFIPDQFTNIIVEYSQGLLLDEYYGFHPHTTWSRTTPGDGGIIILENDMEVTTYGVIRGYHTRHGNGPFPSYMPDKKIESDHNTQNEWQGEFRFGAFDSQLFEYSLSIVGKYIDGVFVTCLDHADNGIDFCTHYTNELNDRVTIVDKSEPNPFFLKAQEILGKHLSKIKPNIINITIEELLDYINKKSNVLGLSTGPTYKDKELCVM